MDADVRQELWARAAQGIALENVLCSLLSELERSRILDAAAFTRLFDQAEDCRLPQMKGRPLIFSRYRLSSKRSLSLSFLPLRIGIERYQA
jgi:hypothetical protein